MKTIIKLLSIFLVSIVTLSAQESSVASVGGYKISVDELKERFQFTPQVYAKKQLDTEAKKHELLYSIIAEKLWALEAENQNLDTTAAMQSAFKMIEKMFVRDALYKAEITDKIKIDEEAMTREMEKYFTSLSLYFLYSPDSSTANRYYEKLQSGASVYSILTPGELEVPMIEVEYGDMKPEIEQKLFALKEHEYTEPIKTGEGWLIFYLEQKNQKSFTSEDVNSALKQVEKLIREKQESVLFERFMKEFFAGKKVNIDGSLFWRLSELIAAELQKKKSSDVNDSLIVKLDAADYKNISAKLGADSLNLPFINFEDKPLTVNDFLEIITFEGFGSNMTDLNSVSYLLDKKVKTVIENELIAGEAYLRGYQNIDDVKKSITMWRDNYLARAFKNKIISSVEVTEKEVYDYYLGLNAGDIIPVLEVNIIELLTDSLEVIQMVLDKLNEGADFRELAVLHTKRVWVKNNNGEFGFFPVTSYGEIGKAAALMEIGDLYGPVKVDEGYSLFKLIAKKEPDTKTDVPFEEIKDKLSAEVKIKKLERKFINTTVELANKYGVKVNNRVLYDTQLKDYQMLTFRYMGFGGRLLAAPLTIPFTEWVTPWLEQQKENP